MFAFNFKGARLYVHNYHPEVWGAPSARCSQLFSCARAPTSRLTTVIEGGTWLSFFTDDVGFSVSTSSSVGASVCACSPSGGTNSMVISAVSLAFFVQSPPKYINEHKSAHDKTQEPTQLQGTNGSLKSICDLLGLFDRQNRQIIRSECKKCMLQSV